LEVKEEKLSRAISALSRRQILRILANQESTVKEVAEKTQQSVSLASRHLKLLYDLGFLNVRKVFPNKFYSLKFPELKHLLKNYEQTIAELDGEQEQKEEKLSRAINAFSRREIFRFLLNNEMTVKEISDATNLSVSLASRHLKMLYDLGFLDLRKKFPNKFYSLKIKQMQALLEAYNRVIGKL
jgi:DNA-binding transcriptional ArsR family regulator